MGIGRDILVGTFPAAHAVLPGGGTWFHVRTNRTFECIENEDAPIELDAELVTHDPRGRCVLALLAPAEYLQTWGQTPPDLKQHDLVKDPAGATWKLLERPPNPGTHLTTYRAEKV